MESVIRRGVRFGYCTTNQAPLAELVAEADETLFKNILHIKQRASSTVAGQNAINLQPSLKKTWLLVVREVAILHDTITRILYGQLLNYYY